MMIRKPSGGQKKGGPFPRRPPPNPNRAPANSGLSAHIIPQTAHPCQEVVGTSWGGPLVWAVDDALATLQRELAAEGLPCPWPAIERARTLMMQATYMPRLLDIPEEVR